MKIGFKLILCIITAPKGKSDDMNAVAPN